jgi:hypothetical protein
LLGDLADERTGAAKLFSLVERLNEFCDVPLRIAINLPRMLSGSFFNIERRSAQST